MSPTAPGSGSVPGRSRIENWDIDHLETSATRWRASANEFEEEDEWLAEFLVQHQGVPRRRPPAALLVAETLESLSVNGEHGAVVNEMRY